ncbi:glucosyl transferase [Microvirga terrae]|uniref:Glucosyl transferase n=1 Tax=Microvirga terrae TaxID=2740529 RepID=A0ABY5RR38_9HYPH|nr:glycosyltransferase [Microvirga terrae]UVF18414.1 glucosyl transferase [Microvirga terrae]
MTRLADPEQALSIAYFGHDARETAVQKRISSLQANGCRIVAFTYSRRYQAERASVPFDNIPLGTTVDRNYLRRLVPLAVGLIAAVRHARVLREVDIIQARNIDMLALALAARFICGSRARVVYEVLDVQRIFVGKGWTASFIRGVERLLLRRIDLLLISSPDFVKEYFEPLQRYGGPRYLLENKISASQVDSAPRAYAKSSDGLPAAAPWVIGWFGVLRCRKSLNILAAIADELGSTVKIYIRGRLSREDISETEFSQVVNARPNIIFEGPYASPEDLATIYGKVHFSWSVDFTDAGANSDWLLPNRLYEGGYFGAVGLARQGTTTARMVAEHELGQAFPQPLEQSVCDFIRDLDGKRYSKLRAAVMAKPRRFFVDETDTHDYVEQLMRMRRVKAPLGDRRTLRMNKG